MTSIDVNPGIVPLASVRRRAAALVYEALLVAALAMVATALALPLVLPFDPLWRRPLIQLVMLAAISLYFVYCWTRSGQTLPMKTWRLRLVTATGRPLTTRDAWRRVLLATLSVGAAGCGYLWAAFDRDRQFLHDRLAGTRIVYIDPSVPAVAHATAQQQQDASAPLNPP